MDSTLMSSIMKQISVIKHYYHSVVHVLRVMMLKTISFLK